MGKTLLKYAANQYSQNGEDGILAEIFQRLNITKGWFVEFGAWDGKHMSNTYALVRKGWSGVEIEGEHERVLDLMEEVRRYPKQLHPIEAFVSVSGKNSLDNLLKPTPLPTDFELLSIDIDSYDWLIWESFVKYHPKVVVIEINSSIPLGREFVQPAYYISPSAGLTTSSSFTSMLKLGQSKGYTLVCHTGNMIFVRSDLVEQLHLPPKELSNPNKLFLDHWVEKEPYLRIGLQYLKRAITRR
jgi:hypothetical protein